MKSHQIYLQSCCFSSFEPHRTSEFLLFPNVFVLKCHIYIYGAHSFKTTIRKMYHIVMIRACNRVDMQMILCKCNRIWCSTASTQKQFFFQRCFMQFNIFTDFPSAKNQEFDYFYWNWLLSCRVYQKCSNLNTWNSCSVGKTIVFLWTNEYTFCSSQIISIHLIVKDILPGNTTCLILTRVHKQSATHLTSFLVYLLLFFVASYLWGLSRTQYVSLYNWLFLPFVIHRMNNRYKNTQW